MQTIEIQTSDIEIIDDLKVANIPGLKVQKLEFRADCADLPFDISNIPQIINIVISSSSTIALSLFSNWLYERIVKKKPDKTTINNTNVINNPEQITLIINNHIQIIENQKKNRKKK